MEWKQSDENIYGDREKVVPGNCEVLSVRFVHERIVI